jgi:hypothetical protein
MDAQITQKQKDSGKMIAENRFLKIAGDASLTLKRWAKIRCAYGARGKRGSARDRKDCAPEFAQDENREGWAGSRSGECG